MHVKEIGICICFKLASAICYDIFVSFIVYEGLEFVFGNISRILFFHLP